MAGEHAHRARASRAPAISTSVTMVVAALAPMLPERAEVHAERREVEDQRLEPTIERDAVRPCR